MEFITPKTRPRRQKLAIALFVAQLLTVLAALIASWPNVESILVTGPLLVIIGLALAVVVRPLGAWAPLLFGLSGPLVSAIIAFTIAAFRLQPAEAAGPVFTMFAIYSIVIVPVAIVANGPIRQWHVGVSQTQPRAWRYSIKSLLGLMTVVAILTATLTSIVEAIYYFPVSFAAFGSVAMVLSGVVVWRFLVLRRRVPDLLKAPIQD